MNYHDHSPFPSPNTLLHPITKILSAGVASAIELGASAPNAKNLSLQKHNKDIESIVQSTKDTISLVQLFVNETVHKDTVGD